MDGTEIKRDYSGLETCFQLCTQHLKSEKYNVNYN